MRTLALRALKTTAATLDRLRPPDPGVVVLIYHRVGGGSGLELDLAVDAFDAQMAALASSGRAITLDAALESLSTAPAPNPPAPNPVVVTFDDGTPDFVEHALPILVRHHIPATLYLATAYVDEQRPFPYGAPAVSWSALHDATSTGLVTVGSHTHTHALLDRCDGPQVEAELERSRGLIEEHLGVEAAHFAYPKALAGTAVAEAAVRVRFRSAALAGTRANPYGTTNPYRLARSPIQASDATRWFEAKTNGGMHFEDAARETLNRWRYSGAGS